MVNERYEAQQYLEGKKITNDNAFRAYYLMTCLLRESGLSKDEIRAKVKEWEEVHSIKKKYDVNKIVRNVFDYEDEVYLCDPIVKINKRDVEIINSRFDNKKTKLIALAMLCYAKAYANKENEFHISTVALSAWSGLHRKTIASRYIKELIDFGYLETVKKFCANREWSGSYRLQSTKYRIKLNLHNSGDNILEGNDIRLLFSRLF